MGYKIVALAGGSSSVINFVRVFRDDLNGSTVYCKVNLFAGSVMEFHLKAWQRETGKTRQLRQTSWIKN